MGYLARLLIGIGIVYWLAPAPTSYRLDYTPGQEQREAETILSSLAALSERKDVPRDDIDALVLKAGQALAALNEQTRRQLIEHYLGSGDQVSILRKIAR